LRKSINGIQQTLTFLLETQYKDAKRDADRYADVAGWLFAIGLIIALFAAIFYFAPAISVVLLAMISPPMFLFTIFVGLKDTLEQGMCAILMWGGGSVYMALVGPKLLSALEAASGFCHGMAIFSYVLAGISAFLLVCGLLNSMLCITCNKNTFFEEKIAPALKSEPSKPQNQEKTDEAEQSNSLASPSSP
jgi:hypothetical protein